MTLPVNELIVCALRRGMKPLDSGQVLDRVHGLAAAAGWPEEPMATVSRQVVSRRLRALTEQHRVQQVGVALDSAHRRPVPTYGPVDGYDPDADVPDAPGQADEEAESLGYEDMSRAQLLTVIGVMDEVAGTVGRFMRDLEDVQRRAKRALTDAGLGDVLEAKS